MANTATLRPAAGLSANFFAGTFARVAQNISDWNDARTTRNQLLKLSQRELADIGLTTGDIEAVATRTYRR